jgi:hypothetical protein
MRCTSAEGLRNFRPSYGQWSRNNLTLIQIKISDTTAFKSECLDFKTKLNSDILNLIAALSGNNFCYVTTPAFLTQFIANSDLVNINGNKIF